MDVPTKIIRIGGMTKEEIRQEALKAEKERFPRCTGDKENSFHGVNSAYGLGFVDGALCARDYKESLWISVKDRLPEQDEEVIALCDDLNAAPLYKISFAHVVDKTMCQDYNGWNIPNVVYWFPIPKLPKE